ncbi:hypothetical protein [Olsenella uli]|uniref:hypothetical protein n=1 Tax=Olsenella uli TaxID=133926 RepID=UPI0012AB3864|nr:hypothetical protein [Olsenella uli]
MNDCQPDIILAPYSGISEDEYNKLSETAPVVQTCSRFATKVQPTDSSDARVSSQDSRSRSRWCRGAMSSAGRSVETSGLPARFE